MEIIFAQAKKVCERLNLTLKELKFLSRGNFNECYLIKTETQKLVLRIENNCQFKNLKKEYNFLKKLDGKFGPKVFCYDDSKKVINNDFLVEEFIEGEHPERKVNNDFVKAMALFYKKLHKNKKIIKNKKKYPLIRFKDYKKNTFKHKIHLDLKQIKKLERIFLEIENLFKKYSAFPNKRKYFSLVQGDPSRTNIFYSKKKVRLIDWEFVGYNFPEVDLAFFFYSFDLNKKQKELFLNQYDYPKTKTALNILKVFKILHYVSMINWKLERLGLVKQGKVDLKQGASTEEFIIKEIKEDLTTIKSLLKE